MSEPIPAHPGLYSPTSDGAPPLNGALCSACGYVFFPPQTYGCEICGAPGNKLEPKSLAGAGVLRSFATVHLHQGKGIEAPFTIGLIVLDDGPAIRATLTARTDEGLTIGDRMRSVMVQQSKDEPGREVVELRFEKATPR